MKEFRRDEQGWIDVLPYYGTASVDGRHVQCAGMFPGSRGAKREHVEEGFRASKNTTPEEVYFNHMMGANTAAFADIIGEFTGHLYRNERTLAIFKVLSVCWRRRVEQGAGSRVWLRSVCLEVVPPRTDWGLR